MSLANIWKKVSAATVEDSKSKKVSAATTVEDNKSKREVKFKKWEPGDEEDKAIYNSTPTNQKQPGPSNTPNAQKSPKTNIHRPQQINRQGGPDVIIVMHSPNPPSHVHQTWHPPMAHTIVRDPSPGRFYFSSGMVPAVLSILFCPILGCLAVVKAFTAQRLYDSGFYAAALVSSKQAKIFALVAVVLGLMSWIWYVPYRVNRRRTDVIYVRRVKNGTVFVYEDSSSDASPLASPCQYPEMVVTGLLLNALVTFLGLTAA